MYKNNLDNENAVAQGIPLFLPSNFFFIITK